MFLEVQNCTNTVEIPVPSEAVVVQECGIFDENSEDSSGNLHILCLLVILFISFEILYILSACVSGGMKLY